MANDPKPRPEQDPALDALVESPGREGLVGAIPRSACAAPRDPDEITIAPDFRPHEEQPRWRQDFPVDWPEDQFVARRDFTRFLVLISGAFAAGQAWIAAQHLVRSRRPKAPRMKVASRGEIEVGSARMFNYPGEHDACLLIRTGAETFVAYSQKCTHLSCAVVPRVAEGVLHCPCHEGYFDLHTGRNIAGPPPRPLPAIELEVVGDEVFAVGVRERAV